jgi:hypothetical protein
VLGRASCLDLARKHLQSLFDVLHMAIRHDQFGDVDDEGESALLFIVREGYTFCREMEIEIALLQDMARTQEQKDYATRKEA